MRNLYLKGQPIARTYGFSLGGGCLLVVGASIRVLMSAATERFTLQVALLKEGEDPLNFLMAGGQMSLMPLSRTEKASNFLKRQEIGDEGRPSASSAASEDSS